MERKLTDLRVIQAHEGVRDRDDGPRQGYEAPMIAVIGPLEKITLGSTGTKNDQAIFKQTSDSRLKENVRPLEGALVRVRQLSGIRG